MITRAHFVLYSSDVEADRAFFRDVLGFRYVDDGGGWLIFALPPGQPVRLATLRECRKH